MKGADLTAGQQTAMLADRYSQRAEAYDGLWSPIIRPVGELGRYRRGHVSDGSAPHAPVANA